MTDPPEEPKTDEVKSGDPVGDALETAAERFRTTAKWLVTTFGALAAAIVTGLKLSDLGKLDGTDQTVAAIGASVALIAVVLVVTFAARVLASGRVPLADITGKNPKNRRLAEELRNRKTLFVPYASLDEFNEKFNEQWTKQAKAWEEMQTAGDPAAKAEAKKRFDETKQLMPQLNRLNSRLLAVARHEEVRLRFESAAKAMTVLAVIAGLGIALFAVTDSIAEPKAETTPAIESRPVPATLDLTDAGKEKFRDDLGGKQCDLDKVDVLALAADDTSVEVVSLPTHHCKVARFPVNREDDGDVEGGDLDLPEP